MSCLARRPRLKPATLFPHCVADVDAAAGAAAVDADVAAVDADVAAAAVGAAAVGAVAVGAAAVGVAAVGVAAVVAVAVGAAAVGAAAVAVEEEWSSAGNASSVGSPNPWYAVDLRPICCPGGAAALPFPIRDVSGDNFPRTLPHHLYF